jgi:hypothetical protein
MNVAFRCEGNFLQTIPQHLINVGLSVRAISESTARHPFTLSVMAHEFIRLDRQARFMGKAVAVFIDNLSSLLCISHFSGLNDLLFILLIPSKIL